MGGNRPLLERYHDALEIVRKQAIALEELEAINARQAETIAMLKTAPNLFHDVMTISPTYVKRFGGTPTEVGVLGKLAEEQDEFDKAIGAVINEGETPERLEHMTCEFIDVMVTAGGVLAHYGVSWADIEQAARATLDKLEGRTEELYAWNPVTKTVEKKSKIGVNHG
jgi:hypothetical protein